MYKIKSTIEGLRFAAFPSFLKDIAFHYDVKLTMDISKGWLREKIRYVMESESEQQLLKCKRAIEKGIEEYIKD